VRRSVWRARCQLHQDQFRRGRTPIWPTAWSSTSRSAASIPRRGALTDVPGSPFGVGARPVGIGGGTALMRGSGFLRARGPGVCRGCRGRFPLGPLKHNDRCRPLLLLSAPRQAAVPSTVFGEVKQIHLTDLEKILRGLKNRGRRFDRIESPGPRRQSGKSGPKWGQIRFGGSGGNMPGGIASPVAPKPMARLELDAYPPQASRRPVAPPLCQAKEGRCVTSH